MRVDGRGISKWKNWPHIIVGRKNPTKKVRDKYSSELSCRVYCIQPKMVGENTTIQKTIGTYKYGGKRVGENPMNEEKIR